MRCDYARELRVLADFPAESTLMTLLARNAKEFPRRVAFREKDFGIWHCYTWKDYLDEVLALAAGLEALGFGQGDSMLILGDNRPQIYFGMVGCAALRGLPAPVFPDSTPREILHVFKGCRANYALAEDQEQVDKVLDLRERAGSPSIVIYKDPRGLSTYNEHGLISYQDVRSKGMARLGEEPELAQRLVARCSTADGVAFLHSSGTTGDPKGVVISHRHLLAAVRSGYLGGLFTEGEELMAYLPIAWMGDTAYTLAAGIALGFTANIPERQETLLYNLREVPPSFFLAPPRMWENMLTAVQVRMAESTPMKRRLYDYFIRVAMELEKARNRGQSPTIWQRLLRQVGQLVVLGPINDHLGLSRARQAVSGGEAIGEETFLFFRALGTNFKQGYGLTETAGVGAAMEDGDVRLHSVGRPLAGVEIKVDERGEICIRGENVFDGYHQDPDATERALRDGWFHTGDAGYFEEDGHLVVLGRAAEVVSTAQGHRYVPNFVENQLKFNPFIKDAAVLGAGRPFLGAIVCVDLDAVGHWAELRGITYTSYADLSQKPQVYDLVREGIQRVNLLLPEGLRIKRFVNLHKEFDPDDGELTRTRKLRRKVIEERYREVIEAIYEEREQVSVEAVITYESGDTGVIRRALSIQAVE